MRKMSETGKVLLRAQKKLAYSRRLAREAEELVGKAIMKSRHSYDVCDAASELIAKVLRPHVNEAMKYCCKECLSSTMCAPGCPNAGG